jgi:aminopeptidase N
MTNDDFTFNATMYINVSCLKVDDNIIKLHSRHLNILNVKINNINTEFVLEPHNELLIIKPTFDISDKNLKIKINYDGVVSDDLNGFYKSKHGDNKYLLTTKFEPNDARQAFPCFDEPSLKATFDIIIITDPNLTVLSNCGIKSETFYNGLKITTFETTPIMSTYLVSFIIGEMGYVEGVSKSNKKIRIYTTDFDNIKKSKLEYAKNVTIKCLDWFEKYFDIEYPINKMDMVAVPDFEAGAMENWGLITFRPEFLLVDETDLLKNRIHAVVTIGHEISHQWFGNYVTMKYWNYLWLNESMATYFGWLVCDELYPEWNVWNVFINSEYLKAFELDSLVSSHQVEFDESIFKNPKDVNQVFDSISYSKGGCLIKGLAENMGFDIFRNGMIKYLKDNAWKNTTSKDLWNAFNFVSKSNYDINVLMHSWISQTGYPLVTIKKQPNNNYLLTQEKYLKVKNDLDKTLWKIPINITVYHNDDINFYMDTQTKIINIDQSFDIIVNENRFGFYKVLYLDEIDNLPFDIKTVSTKVLSQILSDYFTFGFDGYQNLIIPIKLIQKINLLEMKDPFVWITIITNYINMYNMLNKYDGEQEKWIEFLKQTIYEPVKQLISSIGYDGVDNEPVNNEYLRPVLIDFLNLMNDENLINHVKNNNNIDTINVKMKNSNDADFSQIINLLNDNNIETHKKNAILMSFCEIQHYERINYILTDLLEKNIRSHDIPFVLSILSKNKFGTDIVWNIAKKNWNNDDIFNTSSSNISSIVKVITTGFNTENELKDYDDFFKIKPEGTELVIKQTIEKIKNKILCVDRVKNALVDLKNL